MANSATTATSLNIGNAIVARGVGGNFAAGTITAALAGNALTATTAANFSGSLAGDVTGTQSATVVRSVGGATAANVAAATALAISATSTNTPATIVRRDAGGGFSAGALTLSGVLLHTHDDGFVSVGAFGAGSIPATGAGTRMMWYPRKAAFRAGRVTGTRWDDTNIGDYSFGAGYRALASGSGSVAIGTDAQASADGGVALGSNVAASATGAVALGTDATASGAFSTAMGQRATAGFSGSFVYGDNSANSTVSDSGVNQFIVRAAGGTTFYSNSKRTAGVTLAAGGGAWASVSDATLKENWRDVDGEAVLGKLATLRIGEWNYTSQPAHIRHVGPTAQDFYGAFGLGEDSTRISTIDPDGISLIAIQALERRTRELEAAMRLIAALQTQVNQFGKRLAELEARDRDRD